MLAVGWGVNCGSGIIAGVGPADTMSPISRLGIDDFIMWDGLQIIIGPTDIFSVAQIQLMNQEAEIYNMPCCYAAFFLSPHLFLSR